MYLFFSASFSALLPFALQRDPRRRRVPCAPFPPAPSRAAGGCCGATRRRPRLPAAAAPLRGLPSVLPVSGGRRGDGRSGDRPDRGAGRSLPGAGEPRGPVRGACGAGPVGDSGPRWRRASARGRAASPPGARLCPTGGPRGGGGAPGPEQPLAPRVGPAMLPRPPRTTAPSAHRAEGLQLPAAPARGPPARRRRGRPAPPPRWRMRCGGSAVIGGARRDGGGWRPPSWALGSERRRRAAAGEVPRAVPPLCGGACGLLPFSGRPPTTGRAPAAAPGRWPGCGGWRLPWRWRGSAGLLRGARP